MKKLMMLFNHIYNNYVMNPLVHLIEDSFFIYGLLVSTIVPIKRYRDL